jgi:hypothetical protein
MNLVAQLMEAEAQAEVQVTQGPEHHRTRP